MPRDILDVLSLDLRAVWSNLAGQLGTPLVPLGQVKNKENENVQQSRSNGSGDISLEHSRLLGLLEKKHWLSARAKLDTIQFTHEAAKR